MLWEKYSGMVRKAKTEGNWKLDTFFLKNKIFCFFENVDVPVWHFEVNFRILVCQLVIYLHVYVYITYMYYVYVLCICIMYMYYVLCICILCTMYMYCVYVENKIITITSGSWGHGRVWKGQIQQRRQHTQGGEKRRPTT